MTCEGWGSSLSPVPITVTVVLAITLIAGTSTGAELKSRAAPDSSGTVALDRTVQALLAGGHGADSSTIALAVRAVRAHERLQGAQGGPTAAAMTTWARCLAARRKDAAAASAFDRALAIEVAQSAPDSLRVA